MRGISLEKQVIVYYGNAAGYVKGQNAVVDPMFESQELKEFLKTKAGIREITWKAGVFDRLTNGSKEISEMTVLKNCRVWQLKSESDIMMRFISYQEQLERFGEPVKENYQVVYDGKVESNDLETLYVKFNHNHPRGYTGHSLSMSDIIELYDDTNSEFYYCDRIGFQSIRFEEPEQGLTMNF